jgi:hypothetical protein
MLVSERTIRNEGRQSYGYRCGYCGVHEEEIGSELEIDHFQPRVAGGGEEAENLVYCCSTCNRLKANFWPATNPAETQQRLLHPQRDALQSHLHEEKDGLLVALTATGAFHIDRLRLNRPPLVALRRARQRTLQVQNAFASAQEEVTQLRARVALLEEELEKVLTQLSRLLGR